MKVKSKFSSWQPLLRTPQFRWLLTGHTTMFFAFTATVLIRSLLAWQITDDEMSLAYINLVAATCMFCTSIFSGAVIDRVERRKLMLVGQSVLLIVELVTFTLLVTETLTFPYLLVSAFFISVTLPFVIPARTAMVVEAVGRPAVAKAMAMLSAGMNISRMVSPALVGFIADLSSIVHSYVYLLVLHVVSLACALATNKSHPHEDASRGGVFKEIGGGFKYILHNKPLALCLLFGLMPVMAVIPFQNMMVVFADLLWDRGASGLGLMMGAMGLGGVAGSVLIATVKEGQLVKPMVCAATMVGVFLLTLSHISSFSMAVIVIFCIYSSSVLTQTLVNTGVQLMTIDRYRGRISTMSMMSAGMAPIATLPLAYATKHFGATLALTVTGSLLVVSILLMCFLVPSFRKIDDAAKIH